MEKYTYEERLEYLIKCIKQHPSFMTSHSSIQYGDTVVGFYTAVESPDYFSIKHNKIVVTKNSIGGIVVEYPIINQFNTFSLDKWLQELELIITENNYIVLNNKKYLLQEVK